MSAFGGNGHILFDQSIAARDPKRTSSPTPLKSALSR
jgi:hypothetical protein